jgi:hypothetical protein
MEKLNPNIYFNVKNSFLPEIFKKHTGFTNKSNA